MEVTIKRLTENKTVNWAGSNDSDPITINGSSTGLQLILPVEFSGTTLTYKTLDPVSNAWVPVQKAGTNVSDTVAGGAANCNVLSAADLFGLSELKIVSSASETCKGTLKITA